MDRNHDVLPPFLSGCFDWTENGLHFKSPPPIDLLSQAALTSENPWIVIASVIEHAKGGNHREATRLIPFFLREQPFALSKIALLVFGDLAPSSQLPALADVLRGQNDDVRRAAAEAAALSGSLHLIPALLDAWNLSQRIGERETIGFAISDILEPEPGPIAQHANIYSLPPEEPPNASPALVRMIKLRREALAQQEPPEFLSLVAQAHRELERALGSTAFVFAGSQLSVVDVARRLFEHARDPERNILVSWRHRLESATGMDCCDFFYAGKPQRLVIQAAAEEFLQSPAATRYQPGQRYFFGHQIPV